MQAKKTKAELHDKDLLRYNRNIVLPEIDIDGQLTLSNSKVAVIGLGGLGCPAATYLVSSGIGDICLVDFDSVSLSNLNRQVLFNENNISEDKVIAAKRNLNLLNSDTNIQTIPKKVDKNFDYNLLDNYDVIIDCTDNFQSRSYVNEISLHNKIPLISGAAIKFEGQVAIFRNDLTDSPCYRCLYPNLPQEAESCLDSGILGSVTGLVGMILATECVKLLCSIDDTLSNKLMLVDLKKNEFRTIKLSKDEKCKFCK